METKNLVGVPTVKGMTGSIKDAGIGGVGALLYMLSQNMFGTGLWGAIIGIALAGSVVKGTAGEIISVVLGFEAVKSLMAGGGSIVNTSAVNTGGYIAV